MLSSLRIFLGCDPRTVRMWIHRFNAEGVGGLGKQSRSQSRVSCSLRGSPRLVRRRWWWRWL
ncbi:helix-turn-helix domain-containing protein [Rhizocola hellebori]|uniref:helix-turn-helix domain-containing protein n=1 Tax=Rhizocola hellebori TaxID=1392758 RepID=UPI003571297D